MLIDSTPLDIQMEIMQTNKSTYLRIRKDIIRFGLLVLCACLTMTLVGCGSDSDSAANSDTNQPQSSDGRIVIADQLVPDQNKPTRVSPTSTPINHPLVLTFTPAPVNLPAPATTPAPIQPYIPRLPTGSLPIVIQSVNSLEFRGLLDMTGTITIDEQSTNVASDSGDESMIAYRLPQAMRELPQGAFSGGLRIKDTSDIGATRRETWVFDDIGLVFADVVQALEEPVRLEIAGGVRLVQRQVNETETSDVFADIVTTDGNSETVVTLPLFSPMAVSAAPRDFQVFLELSEFRKSEPTIGDSISGYAVHIWIVGITR